MSARSTVEDPVGAIALLDEPKRRRLYEFVVARHVPVSRDEAASESGVSRELAAFHLDRLVVGGLLETEFKRLNNRRGPGAGRPAKLYRRTGRDLAVSLPFRDYKRAADLLAEAVDRLDGVSGTTGRAAVADAARARGETDGLEARWHAGPRPSRQRLRTALLDSLRRGGYEPEVAPDTGRISLRSCPFDALVARHRDLTCGMNVAWAEGVMKGLGHVDLEPALNPIDGSCCVVFQAQLPTMSPLKRPQDSPAELTDAKG
ncbi:MAG: transcriptional regulator [Candidatus Limnocylindrales bacterium]